MIRDILKLPECLAYYFKSNKVKSFIRQFYIYGFKCVAEGQTKKYFNPRFTKDAYHKLISIKRQSKPSVGSERSMMKAEFKLLQSKYDKLLTSALELYRQVDSSVQQNKENIMSVVEFNHTVLHRLKAVVLKFVLNFVNYDPKINKSCFNGQNINLVNKSVLEICDQNVKCGLFGLDSLRQYIHEVILSTDADTPTLSGTLKEDARCFNDRFFHLPHKLFYSSLIEFILESKEVPVLENHENYAILVTVKESYQTISEALLSDQLSSNTHQSLNESISKTEVSKPDGEKQKVAVYEEDNRSTMMDAMLSLVGGNLFTFLNLNYNDNNLI